MHHLTYRGGKDAKGMYEKPGDLVTFCPNHHNGFHQRYGTDPFGGKFLPQTVQYIKEEQEKLGLAVPPPKSKKTNAELEREATGRMINESVRHAAKQALADFQKGLQDS